jgi:hypothetical protein
MPTIVEEAVATQRRYYSETATNYEQMHAHEGKGEAFNKKFIEAILQMLGAICSGCRDRDRIPASRFAFRAPKRFPLRHRTG